MTFHIPDLGVFDENGKVEGWGSSYFRTHYDYAAWSNKAVKKVLE